MRFLTVGLFVLIGLPLLGAQTADHILVNGKIVTVDNEFQVAQALAIRGERILAVGTNEEVRAAASSDAKVTDLAGKTVIPGLIDNHVHFMRAVQQWHRQARIDGVSTRAEALKLIAKKASSMRSGEWIMVQGGWSQGQFSDKKGGFSLAELDAAAPNNPLYIQQTYRSVYVNTKALEAVGMSAADGAEQRGRPSIGKFARQVPAPSQAQIEKNLLAVIHDFNRAGLTTVYGVGRPTEGDPALPAEMAKNQAIPMRFFHTLRYRANGPGDVAGAIELINANKPLSRDLQFGLVGLGEHIYGPFSDNTMRTDEWPADIVDQFGRIARVAADAGWQIHEHTMADVSVRALLDEFEDIHEKSPIDELRWTLAHVDTITPESIERAKKLGMGLAVHAKSMHQAYGLRRQLGDRVKGIPPLRDMQESGIVWGLGSDATIVAHYQPFVTLCWAVTGKALDGTKVLDETVSREEALIAHTRANAHLLFMEDDLGTLETGKLADLVVLDRDYLTIPADEIIDIKPVMTIVGGTVGYAQ
jgi:predicted amidohydrolase YtcJ